MRDAFFRALNEAAQTNDELWALTGDLGIGLFDRFQELAPGRFMNVGVAEQAMVGIAAGLAYAGKTAIAYSIIPFLTSRPNDQVRVDVAISHANVKLVGVGGGVAYGYYGPTHHALDDVALMRTLPGLTVLCPADPAEVERATHAMLDHTGPVYLRLGKNGEPALLSDDAGFEIGCAQTVRACADPKVALVSTGPILRNVLAAADELAAHGIAAQVVHFATVKPFDREALLAAARACDCNVVSVEEHLVNGGFGSACAETLAEAGVPARLKRVGFQDSFVREIGNQDYLLAQHQLDGAGIAASVRGFLEGR